MKKILIVLFSALAISSIGALPLGTLNVMAMNISIQQGIASGMIFTLGVLMVEMAYVAITVKLLSSLLQRPAFMTIARMVSIAVMLLLAVWFLIPHKAINASQPSIIPTDFHPFLLGLTMSALNPAQMPFWLGWTTIAIDKKVLERNPVQTMFWVCGAGSGTLLGLSIFVWGGKKMMELSGIGSHMNLVIGLIFLATAVWQLLQLKNHHSKKNPLNT